MKFTLLVLLLIASTFAEHRTVTFVNGVLMNGACGNEGYNVSGYSDSLTIGQCNDTPQVVAWFHAVACQNYVVAKLIPQNGAKISIKDSLSDSTRLPAALLGKGFTRYITNKCGTRARLYVSDIFWNPPSYPMNRDWSYTLILEVYTGDDTLTTPIEPQLSRKPNSEIHNNKYYDISGKILPGKPNRPGVYIYNKRKIVVLN